MALGPPILRRAASARRTSDSGCTGWPTTRATDADKGVRSEAGSAAEYQRKGTGADLPTIATLAGWPTPDSSHHGMLSPDAALARITNHLNGGTKRAANLDDVAALVGWATPTSRYSKDGACQDADVPVNGLLGRQAAKLVSPPLGAWPTPTSASQGSPENPEARKRRGFNAGLSPMDAACLAIPPASGTDTTSSPAGTEKRGVLNPAFSLWLQGYPAEWLCCGVRATQSVRKRQRRSSGRTSKQKVSE